MAYRMKINIIVQMLTLSCSADQFSKTLFKVLNVQDSYKLIHLLFPGIGPFLSTADDPRTVNLGQPLQIPCPAHEPSHGAVYTWQGSENIEFSRNARRAISPGGELFIMFVTDEDINEINQLKGISCVITGANTIYRSGPVTLQKSQEGKELLFYILYYVLQLDAVGYALSWTLEEVSFRFKLWQRSLCSFMLLGKTVHFHNTCLSPARCIMGTGKFHAKALPCRVEATLSENNLPADIFINILLTIIYVIPTVAFLL